MYTILIVDDDESITNTVGRILKPHGYRIITTQNPLEVISILAKQEIDILVSDIEMLPINGLDLMATVRQEFPAVLRILLTGKVTTTNLMRAINESQVFRYLEKPLEPAKLLLTLREATEHLKKLRQSERLFQSARRRENMMREIEEEHPEILTLQLHDGSYILDTERLLAIGQDLDSPLRELLLSEKKTQ